MNDLEVRSIYELCNTNLIFLVSHILSDTKPEQRLLIHYLLKWEISIWVERNLEICHKQCYGWLCIEKFPNRETWNKMIYQR